MLEGTQAAGKRKNTFPPKRGEDKCGESLVLVSEQVYSASSNCDVTRWAKD